MEARSLKILLAVVALSTVAATHRTTNFVVTAPTPEIAAQVANHAEHYRREIAIEWLGRELPRWYAPCPIQVKVGQIGAGGATSFSFDRGHVFGWNMNIQGSLERILDSVLPHEVSHTIFACYFRRPLPRWADEGAATLAEHESEKRRQVLTVQQIIRTRKRIPLRTLVAMKDYPPDMQDVLTLYAEGYSLAELLVQQGGKARYLAFLVDAHEQGWDPAVQKHYGYQGLDALEKTWHEWIVAGSPALNLKDGVQLAAAQPPQKAEVSERAVIRGQSPETDPFLADEAVALSAPQPPTTGIAMAPSADYAAAVPQRSEEAARPTKKRGPRRLRSASPPDMEVNLGEAADSPAAPQARAMGARAMGTRATGGGAVSRQNAGWEGVSQSPPTEPADEPRDMAPAFNLPSKAGTASPRNGQQTGHQRRPKQSPAAPAGTKASPRPLPPSSKQPKTPQFAEAQNSGRRRSPQWSEFPQEPRGNSQPTPFGNATADARP